MRGIHVAIALAVGIGGLSVLLLTNNEIGSRTDSAADDPEPREEEPRTAPKWHTPPNPHVPERLPTEIEATPSPSGAASSENPVLAVAGLGIDDAIAEREELYAALQESGPADSMWATAATEKLEHVAGTIRNSSLGTTRHLGCWRAGCALRIAFSDPIGSQNLERLSLELMRGSVAGSVVVTAPNREGPDRHVAVMFLLARQDPARQ
jgi:hypothetical protein